MMGKQGHQQGQSNHIIFFQHTRDGGKTILIVYVDDIIMIGHFGRDEETKKKNTVHRICGQGLGINEIFLRDENHTIKMKN